MSLDLQVVFLIQCQLLLQSHSLTSAAHRGPNPKLELSYTWAGTKGPGAIFYCQHITPNVHYNMMNLPYSRY